MPGIKSLWKELKRSKKNLIGDKKPPPDSGDADAG